MDAGDERVLKLEVDRAHKYLAVLTRSTLSVWSGKADPVLLATHRRDEVDESPRCEHRNVELVWAPGSTEIAVLAADGSIIYYSLTKLPSYSLPALLPDPSRVEAVSLQLRHRARAADHFFACATQDGLFIMCGTSNGHLARVSWSGLVTSVMTASDAPQAKGTTVDRQDGIGGPTPTSLPLSQRSDATDAAPPADCRVDLPSSPDESAQRVSHISLHDIERSQPATIVRVCPCTRLGLYACVRRDGGVFVAVDSHASHGQADSLARDDGNGWGSERLDGVCVCV